MTITRGLNNRKQKLNVEVIFSFEGKLDGRMQLAVPLPVGLQPLVLLQPGHGLLRRTPTFITKRTIKSLYSYEFWFLIENTVLTHAS